MEIYFSVTKSNLVFCRSVEGVQYLEFDASELGTDLLDHRALQMVFSVEVLGIKLALAGKEVDFWTLDRLEVLDSVDELAEWFLDGSGDVGFVLGLVMTAGYVVEFEVFATGTLDSAPLTLTFPPSF